MSKRSRLKNQVRATEAKIETAKPIEPLKVGSHQFPVFDGAAAAFGASLRDYPAMNDIPDKFLAGNTRFNQAFGALFFRGGKLEDHGLTIKAGLDRAQVMTALRALMAGILAARLAEESDDEHPYRGIPVRRPVARDRD